MFDIRKQLPKHKAELAEDKPSYVTNARFVATTLDSLNGYVPRVLEKTASNGAYKHQLYMKAHPLQSMLEACSKEWDDYQKTWKEQGCTREYIPYPYTNDIVRGWFK